MFLYGFYCGFYCFWLVFICFLLWFVGFHVFILVTETKRADISSDLHRMDPSEYCSGVDDVTTWRLRFLQAKLLKHKAAKLDPQKTLVVGPASANWGLISMLFFFIIFHIHRQQNTWWPILRHSPYVVSWIVILPTEKSFFGPFRTFQTLPQFLKVLTNWIYDLSFHWWSCWVILCSVFIVKYSELF